MPNTEATTVEARGSFISESHGCGGLGGDAFAAAGKAKTFGGGSLHADAIGRDLQYLGDFRLHGVAVRADLGPLADDGEVDMIDDAALRRHQVRGIVEE